MIDRLLSYIAPHICYVCTQTGALLCDSCMYDIIDEGFEQCVWCLRPANLSHQCTECALRTGIKACWAVGIRKNTIKALTDDYKFDSKRSAAKDMSRLLDAIIAVLPADTVVTYVPTTPSHIRTRGFDHAAVLAKVFARRRNLKVKVLFTRQHNLSQHDLGRSARLKAANEAFSLKETAITVPVLLIDDVMTTGATLEACTRLLRQAGAPEIYAAVIARQPLD